MIHAKHTGTRNILVFRALKLGDMLCSLPALKAIRRKFHDSKITLVSHPAMKDLFLRYPHYIDEFISFPGFPGMPETMSIPEKTLEFLSDMQKRNFDLVLQLHGSGELSNSVVSLMNGKRTAGFYREGHFCPDPEMFIHYPENHSEIHRCLFILKALGIQASSDEIDFTVTDFEMKEAQSFLESHGIKNEDYFCIHPGASVASKRWSPSGFASVADHLVQKGQKVVFTGSSIESDLVEEISGLMAFPGVNAASFNLSLGILAALIKGSRGLICNDTGVSHLAAAMKVPSIVIFSETDPVRWAPLDQRKHHWLYRPDIKDVLNEADEFLLTHIEEVV